MIEKNIWLWISLIRGLGIKKIYNLYEYFGDIKKVYNAKYITLKESGILNDKDITNIIKHKKEFKIEENLNTLERNNIKFLYFRENDYPELLKNIHYPPLIIYYKGNIKKDITQKCISIVGSRKATYYGLKTAEKISFELASNGITIISGFARGIDTKAHLGAIKAGGKTIAVLGNGLDIIYPRENEKLFSMILEQGAVISEFILGTKPLPNNFPRRNRIISGLSYGTVVVEAANKSGSLITARYALEQGREIYAVPSNLSSCNSLGTNRLIQDGAKLITETKEILEDFEPMIDNRIVNHKNSNNNEKIVVLSEEEKILLELINLGYCNKEILIIKSKLSINKINYLLTKLEINEKIQIYKNQYFIK